MLTETMLRAMARGKPPAANLQSILNAVNQYGPDAGLDKPWRLAHFLAQILHESGSFKYDREIWGPTKAQKGYEGRKDLGNVQKGDGSRYRGRGPIQITGRANYREFTKWARKIDKDAPNFEANPDLVNTDPWEGLGPIWYWSTRNLNRYADDNNIEMVTRQINGGLNGFEDRVTYYVRAALVILGYQPDAVTRFQQDHPGAGKADGEPGEKTRMALHKALHGANPYQTTETVEVEVPVEVEKPVVPVAVDKAVKKDTNFWGWFIGLFGTGGVGISWLKDADWQTIITFGGIAVVGALILLVLGPLIVRRVKAIRAEIEA
jgi:putative chitinase